LEIIIVLAVLACVALISWRVASENDVSTSLLVFAFIETLIAMQVFRLVIPPEQSDWRHFYYGGLERIATNSGFEYVWPGYPFLIATNHLLHLMTPNGEFSILGMFLVFAFCSFLGHVYLLATCRPYLNLPRDNLWLVLFFLPGLHFWTVALGKVSLIFLALCYILYTVSRSRYPIVPLSLATAVVFMVRPHVMLLLFVAGFLATIFSNGGESMALKIGKVVVTAAVLVLTFPIVAGFVGLNEVTIESATARMEDQANQYQDVDSGVELDRLSPPARLATYMFRPLFFDVHKTLALAASLENAVLLFMFVLFISQGIIPWIFSRPTFAIVFAVFFVLLMWTALGMTTGNLGQALRQKTQIIPYIFYVFLVFRCSLQNRYVESLS
jgi:hypothetical protein